MRINDGDVIGLFGSTDTYRVLHVMSDNEMLVCCELSGHTTIIKLSDVFICASYNKGTIIKTYWDGMIIEESLEGDYRTRWDDDKLSNLDEIMILLDFLGRDVA